MKKETYLKRKEEVRNEAIKWHKNISKSDYCLGQLSFLAEHYYKLGKRYGLLREFRENGII